MDLCHLPDLVKAYKLPMKVLRLEMRILQTTQGDRFWNNFATGEVGGKYFGS